MGLKEEKAHEYASRKYIWDHDMSRRAEESYKAGWDAALQSLMVAPKNREDCHNIFQSIRDGDCIGVTAVLSGGVVVAQTNGGNFNWDINEQIFRYGNREVLALIPIPKLCTIKNR